MRLPSVNSTYQDGQGPLIILRSNVEVRCGPGGSSNNNCTLGGGTSQVVLMYAENQWGIPRPARINNVTIRGLTFTGTLDLDFQFGSSSVLVAHEEAKQIRLMDCRWQHMYSQFFVIFVGINPFMWTQGILSLPTRAIDVSIINSTFTIITCDTSFVAAVGQTVSVEGSRFTNISVGETVRLCQWPGGPSYCNGIMNCAEASQCTLKDSCLENVEYLSNAGLLAAGAQAEWTVSGVVGAQEDLTIVDRQINATFFTHCESGIGQYTDDTFATIECFDQENLEDTNSSPACPLR